MLVRWQPPSRADRGHQPSVGSWSFANLRRTMSTPDDTEDPERGAAADDKKKPKARRTTCQNTQSACCIGALFGIMIFFLISSWSVWLLVGAMGNIASTLTNPANIMLNQTMGMMEDSASLVESADNMAEDAEVITSESVPAMLQMMNSTTNMMMRFEHLMAHPKLGISLEDSD